MFENEKDPNEEYEPIGVHLTASVLVHTDDHEEAKNVARGVAKELSGEMADGDIEVRMNPTIDCFRPEQTKE